MQLNFDILKYYGGDTDCELEKPFLENIQNVQTTEWFKDRSNQNDM